MAGPQRVVIVGGGVAAQRCAFTLRKRGYEGELTIVGAESHPPYDRTLLSKQMLSGDAGQAPAALDPADAYGERGIELRLDTAAVSLDVDACQVALSDGTALAYDRLVIASGGTPITPRTLACPGVLTLREVADLDGIHAALARCERIAIVGGGFIGGEVASSALSHGLEVTLIEAASEPLAPVLGTEVGGLVADLHRAAGVEVMAGVAVAEIARAGDGFEIVFDNVARLAADAVLIGVGMAPAVGWLEGSPLRIEDGIVTDAACRTGVAGVLAAGDCARWHNPRYDALMRVEHWDTAARHGAAAAGAVMGADEPFAPVPFFWSDQQGVKLQWVGYAPTWDSVEIEDGDSPTSFVARYRVGDRLVAAFAAGQPKAIARARKELQATEAVNA